MCSIKSSVLPLIAGAGMGTGVVSGGRVNESFVHTPKNTLSYDGEHKYPAYTGWSFKIVSWNVKGMNSPVKRNKVFNHLTHLNTKIAFLQETHLLPSDHLKLRRGVGGPTLSLLFFK